MFADIQASPTLPAIGAGKDFARGAGQDRLGAIDADRRIVDVGVSDPGYPRPGFAAIATAPYPVDFDTGPHHPVIRRIYSQRGDPRDSHVGAFLGHIGAELVPVGSAVDRPKECGRPSPGED